MLQVKDTLRSTVRLSFDGRVTKKFRGPRAGERFANEVRVLRHLEARGCPFVPRLLADDPHELQIVTTNCGSRVEHLDAPRMKELFAELEAYGVRHDDIDPRNVTYRQADGRFCIIDFEFATILSDSPRSSESETAANLPSTGAAPGVVVSNALGVRNDTLEEKLATGCHACGLEGTAQLIAPPPLSE